MFSQEETKGETPELLEISEEDQTLVNEYKHLLANLNTPAAKEKLAEIQENLNSMMPDVLCTKT